MARRPTAAVLQDQEIVVVCDDGTVWSYQRDQDEWLMLASIPGSPATKKSKKNKKQRKARVEAEALHLE